MANAQLTPSQRAAAKYFVIALALFLVQSLLGGKMAHNYVDGRFDLSKYLPFNIAHLASAAGVFSALEVVPLSLLMVESCGQHKVISRGRRGVSVRGEFLVPAGHRVLESFRRGRARVHDQPSVCELLPAREFLTAAPGMGR